MQPATSPRTCSSATPPAARTRAPTSSGLAGAFAEIEVRCDGRQSMMGELAGRLLDPFVPPGHVMDQDHAGPRSAAERTRVIGFTHISLVAAKGDRLREHAFIGHGVPRQLDGRGHDYT